MITELEFNPSQAKNKRFAVIITDSNGKQKTINFGQPGANTFFDGADDKTRLNYIARHKVNEDWTDPYTAGYWSRWVLWEKRKSETLRFLKDKLKGVKIKATTF